jgi:hypothetical protein
MLGAETLRFSIDGADATLVSVGGDDSAEAAVEAASGKSGSVNIDATYFGAANDLGADLEVTWPASPTGPIMVAGAGCRHIIMPKRV